jgi:hypothetical protein
MGLEAVMDLKARKEFQVQLPIKGIRETEVIRDP